VEPVKNYVEELKHILEKRDKLKRLLLDRDSANNRMKQAIQQSESHKINSLTGEFESAQQRVDQTKVSEANSPT
jgi:predicted component of type VI protein secretion system